MSKASKRKPAPDVELDSRAGSRVTVVTARLFTEDVDELKRRAVAGGMLEWQPLLRRLVHEALKPRKGIIR